MTGTGATTSTYVTLTPTPASGASSPTTSTLNLPANTTLANGATTAIGTGGKIRLYNRAGTINLIADITGLTPVASRRVR